MISNTEIIPGDPQPINKPSLFPNPSAGWFNIGFNIPVSENITIKIYNSDGLLIDDFGTKPYSRGYHQVSYYIHGKRASWYNVLVKGEKGMEKVMQLLVR